MIRFIKPFIVTACLLTLFLSISYANATQISQITKRANVSSPTFTLNETNNSSRDETFVNQGGVQIEAVAPSYGWNNENTWVYIYGDGFMEPLTVTLPDIQLAIQEVYTDRILALVPAGLTANLYDVTVETVTGTATLTNGYEVLEAPTVDDLVSSPDWFWTDPLQLRAGFHTNNSIGINVQRLGGKQTIEEVGFEFLLKTPEGFSSLGRSYTNNLSPNYIEATSPVIWEPDEAGIYTICAQIDPDNEFEETDESNNTTCRTVTVLEQQSDTVPPVVDDFVIADGASSTTEIMVTLAVTATDQETPDQPVSGIDQIEFIEFVYLLEAQRWVPVQRSGWVPYLIAHENYPWTLTTTYGMRYMQAWALDKAGNISNLPPGIDVINLVPEEQIGFVAKNQVVFYRMFLEQGDTFEAILTPISGDPDLHVWGASDEPWYSTHPTDVDSVAFEAPETGIYQIEVHGHNGDAEYRLSFGVTESRARAFKGLRSASKPVPSAPTVPLDDLPKASPSPSANEPDLSHNSTVEERTAEGVSITSVSPNYGWNDEERAVFIYGSSFTMPLTVSLLGREITVTEVLTERITAVVPAELPPGWYDVTVEIASGQVATLTNAYQVLLASPHDDFVSFSEWVWMDQLREETPSGMIGLNVQRLGGQETWSNVQVCFELDIAPEPKPLGCREVPFLGPNSVEATFSVPFNSSWPGQYTICAYIDPDNEFEETDESNNTTCRTVTVLEEQGNTAIISIDQYHILPMSTITASVTLNMPATQLLGAARIDVHFDPLVVQVEGCDVVSPLAGYCNPDNESGVISFNIVSASGATGDLTLVNMTLQGAESGQTPLELEIHTFADTLGNSLSVTDIDSDITIMTAKSPIPNSAVANAGDIPLIIESENLQEPITAQIDGVELLSVTLATTDTLYALLPVAELDGRGLYTLTLESAGQTLTLSNAFTVTEAVADAQFLAMIYLACDNNLAGYCQGLLYNLELAMQSQPDLHLVAFWDGNGEGDSAYHVILPDGVNEFPLGEVDSADPRTLVEFVAWAESQYPSDYTLLSLVGHGDGWAPTVHPAQLFHSPVGGYEWGSFGGMLWDNSSQNVMPTHILADALSWSTLAEPLDLLYLDACLMGSIEVMAELAPYAEYTIAHENIAWATYPYDQYLDDVSQESTPSALAQQIAQANRDSWPEFGHPAQISVVRNDSINDVLAKLNTLTVELSATLPISRPAISEVVMNTTHLDGNDDWVLNGEDSTLDAHHFATQLLNHPDIAPSVKIAAQELIEALESNTIIVNHTQNGTPWPGVQNWDLSTLHGLSLYFPLNDEWKRAYYGPQALPRFANSSAWDDFIQAWYAGQEAPPPPDQPCHECLTPPMRIKVESYLLHLPLIHR